MYIDLHKEVGYDTTVTCMTQEQRREVCAVIERKLFSEEGMGYRNWNEIRRTMRKYRAWIHKERQELKVLRDWMHQVPGWNHPPMYSHPVIVAVRERIKKIEGHIAKFQHAIRTMQWYFDHLKPRTVDVDKPYHRKEPYTSNQRAYGGAPTTNKLEKLLNGGK